MMYLMLKIVLGGTADPPLYSICVPSNVETKPIYALAADLPSSDLSDYYVFP